ncbi:hypothetical protein C8Q70DRAFT_221502 [Cubamyces menziesii]|nr:hypothetical protein C8Q70DRAFT_221502 [Cubamyces menziesii]
MTSPMSSSASTCGGGRTARSGTLRAPGRRGRKLPQCSLLCWERCSRRTRSCRATLSAVRPGSTRCRCPRYTTSARLSTLSLLRRIYPTTCSRSTTRPSSRAV